MCPWKQSLWGDSFSQKMILRKVICGDTGEVSAYSLFRATGRQSFDELILWYTQKIVLKRSFVSKIGKTLLCMLIVQFSQETEIWVRRRTLFERWFRKGHSALTQWKTTLHIHCQGNLEDNAHPVYMVLYMKHGLKKAICQWHWRRLCMFIHVSWDAKPSQLIQ